MRKASYSNIPHLLEYVGLGKWYFRQNIVHLTSEDADCYECDEIEFADITELDPVVAKSVIAIASEEDSSKFKSQMLSKELELTDADYQRQIEAYLASQGVNIAIQRQSIRNQVDSLGKVIQTETGNGTMENPFKNWKVGLPVSSGSWYLTPSGFLWECIASGIPSSEKDRHFFDVIE